MVNQHPDMKAFTPDRCDAIVSEDERPANNIKASTEHSNRVNPNVQARSGSVTPDSISHPHVCQTIADIATGNIVCRQQPNGLKRKEIARADRAFDMRKKKREANRAVHRAFENMCSGVMSQAQSPPLILMMMKKNRSQQQDAPQSHPIKRQSVTKRSHGATIE